MLKKVSHAIFLMQKIKLLQHTYKLTDPVEIALMNRIALYQAHDENIAVSNVIKWKDLGSAATLHGRLLRLLKRKLVQFDKSDEDARIRFVKLSETSSQYYGAIGEAMANPTKKLPSTN